MDVRISKGRFEAFSDGVFAIAITLLVLELHPPDLREPSSGALAAALLAQWPDYVVYAASFTTIGIMWFNHYALFHNAAAISYRALLGNLALLLLVCFLPFPTLLIGRFGLVAPAVELYSLTFVGLAVCFNILWYAVRPKAFGIGGVRGFIRTRTVWNTIGAAAYVVAAAAAFWLPVLSIVLIAAVAVYYMLPMSVRGALAASNE
jgi:uncharacterized membrane protein